LRNKPEDFEFFDANEQATSYEAPFQCEFLASLAVKQGISAETCSIIRFVFGSIWRYGKTTIVPGDEDMRLMDFNLSKEQER